MIQVIDNCIPEEMQNEMLSICTSTILPLSYNKYTTSPHAKRILRGFSHLFLAYEGQLSPYADALSKPAKTVLPDKDLVRGRLFLQLPVQTNEIGEYHVDFQRDHLTMIYYVNDTDGDTLFSSHNDSEFPDNMSEGEKFSIVNLENTIQNRVTPKKGRCVVFDGRIYHASSTPTIDDRFVLNYNFKP